MQGSASQRIQRSYGDDARSPYWVPSQCAQIIDFCCLQDACFDPSRVPTLAALPTLTSLRLQLPAELRARSATQLLRPLAVLASCRALRSLTVAHADGTLSDATRCALRVSAGASQVSNALERLRFRFVARNTLARGTPLPWPPTYQTSDHCALQVIAGDLQQAIMLLRSKRVAAGHAPTQQRPYEPGNPGQCKAADQPRRSAPSASLSVLSDDVLAAVLLLLDAPQRADLLRESSLLRRVSLSQRVTLACHVILLRIRMRVQTSRTHLRPSALLRTG